VWLSANLRLVPVESNSSPEKPAWLVWQFAGERSVWLHGGVPGLWARAGGAQMWLSHRARQRGQTREASPQARVQEVLPGLSRPELLHVKEGGRSVCSFSMLFYFTPSHLARGGILCLPHLHPLSQHHPAPRARAPSTDQILLPIIVCNLENGWLHVFLWYHPEVDLMVILQKLSLGGHSW